MHVVIWTAKGQRYATPSSSIVEVIPMVQSRPVHGSEDWLIGLFEFRGDLLPLIDSSILLGEDASVIRMASRIIVTHTAPQAESKTDRIGMIVEQVLGSETLDVADEMANQSSSSSGLEFLGPVTRTPESTVQLIFPQRFPVARY